MMNRDAEVTVSSRDIEVTVSSRDIEVTVSSRDCRRLMVQMQFRTNILTFLGKVGIVSDDFKVTGHSFQILGAAPKKVCFPGSAVLGTKSCCEIDGLSSLRIFER